MAEKADQQRIYLVLPKSVRRYTRAAHSASVRCEVGKPTDGLVPVSVGPTTLTKIFAFRKYLSDNFGISGPEFPKENRQPV